MNYGLLANQGRREDNAQMGGQVAHISAAEADLLRLLGGAGTTNPMTGLPEYWAFGFGPGTVGQSAGLGFGAPGGGGPGPGPAPQAPTIYSPPPPPPPAPVPLAPAPSPPSPQTFAKNAQADAIAKAKAEAAEKGLFNWGEGDAITGEAMNTITKLGELAYTPTTLDALLNTAAEMYAKTSPAIQLFNYLANAIQGEGGGQGQTFSYSQGEGVGVGPQGEGGTSGDGLGSAVTGSLSPSQQLASMGQMGLLPTYEASTLLS